MTLTAYRRRRDFSRSPEPAGTQARRKAREPRFVVQKHWASRLHYDFRLEHEGVLKSWAVPKGPPLKAGERKLAVMVEDHPLDYRKFHGVIPEGNYGAGTVIVWDEGTYRVRDSVDAEDSERRLSRGIERGRIDLVIDGKELDGEFTLVRMRAGQWLFIKKKERPGEKTFREENPIVTNEQAPERMTRQVREKGEPFPPGIDLSGAVPSAMPSRVEPMLATLVSAPFDRPGWLFEVKWDGYRAISSVRDKSVALYSRTSILLNERFPEIVRSLQALPCEAVFDGEIVALDKKGRSDFPLLQNYLRSGRGTLVYYLFDILYLNGYDLRPLPLSRRREILRETVPPFEHIALSEFIREGGRSFYRVAEESGFEGVMAKDGASPYRPGVRGDEWLKIKIRHRQEAVIGGYTAPRGSREYFGALVLGVYEGDELTYIGNAGGGFDHSELERLYRKFEPLAAREPPFARAPEVGNDVVWLRPELVCEVEFAGWTREGCMRQPVYLGLRDDRLPGDVRRELPERGPVKRPDSESARPSVEEKQYGRVTVRLTNKSKVFWPGEGFTKGDVLSYYRDIAPVLLPYLKDRPQNLNRHPDGIYGKSFIQKDVDEKFPEWVRTAPVYSESDARELKHLLCQDEAALLFMANLGCIEINPWHSRLSHLDRPDYLVLDFDPLDVPFSAVVETVLAARAVLDEAEAESFCKTSGATGMHLFVPLGARYSFGQAEEFARVIALLAHERLPLLTSVERYPSRRGGKVYLDYLQNARDKTVVSAYSLRPRRGAPVSAPLGWDEVSPGLDPSSFTLTTIRRRLDRKGDLWSGVIGRGIDMESCVERLERKYAAAGKME